MAFDLRLSPACGIKGRLVVIPGLYVLRTNIFVPASTARGSCYQGYGIDDLRAQFPFYRAD